MFNFKTASLAVIAVLISACAGSPKLPEAGTPTRFDGMWTAKLKGTREACNKASTEFEIRYGHLVGKVYERGKMIADIWGTLNENGELEGEIGQLGISGAHATVTFSEQAGTGTWYSKACKGTVEAQRAG